MGKGCSFCGYIGRYIWKVGGDRDSYVRTLDYSDRLNKKLSNPAFTKLTTITVVVENDWTSAVIMRPVKTPIIRFFVIADKIFRSWLTANF
jgi:hypothetical protein